MQKSENAQVVILAGGYGTRIKEYPEPIPKTMVPIGNKPILWHIMKSYSHYGFNEFIICLGYRAEAIRKYFLNFHMLNNDIEVSLGGVTTNVVQSYSIEEVNWKVTLVDTGIETLTGGRIKRVERYLRPSDFFITYGDTLSDIDFRDQLNFHKKTKAEVTITGVNQHSRFGHIQMETSGKVYNFVEKPVLSDVVSGGFFVANKKFVDRIPNDQTQLESAPLMSAAKQGMLYCYHHKGFWACMDTYRDFESLNSAYAQNDCPWVVWK